MKPRHFSLEEANALLPRLSELLFQLRETKAVHDRLEEQAEEYAHHVSSNGHVVEQKLNETRQEMAKAAGAVNSLIERVNELGCELKDIDQGLVDFLSEREGRDVYLCWKVGEPEIRWWHDLEAGFAGRQPLE